MAIDRPLLVPFALLTFTDPDGVALELIHMPIG